MPEVKKSSSVLRDKGLDEKIHEVLEKTTESEQETLKILYKYGEQTTKEISQKLNKVYSQVSRDLNSLKRKGVIGSRKGEGREVLYTIKEGFIEKYKDAIHVISSDDIDSVIRVTSIKIADLTAKGYEEGLLFIRSDPTLTPQQKVVAEEYFDIQYHRGIHKLLYTTMKEAINTAKKGRVEEGKEIEVIVQARTL